MIIGLIGGAIGLIVGVGAAVLTMGVWGILFGLPFILVFGWVYFKFIQPIFSQSNLLKTGEPATATILEVSDTNMTVNENPVVKLKLKVQPKAGASYETEVKTLISRLQVGYFQPSQMINVRYDVNRPEKVAVESIGATEETVDTETKKQLEDMLYKINERNNDILASGTMAQATIIRSWPMNINVNGNNPLMGFWLEVKPEGESSFEAEVKGAVSEHSLPKFQPGSTVWVKYDVNDHLRVTIDHS